MNYQSNLTAPDLRPYFRHLHWRPMGHSFGHDVASDFSDKPDGHPLAFYKNCGLWTMDEAAILYNVAQRMDGFWLDIGAHSGWTSAHIRAATDSYVDAVDPMFAVEEFLDRFTENTAHCLACIDIHAMTSKMFFDFRYAIEHPYSGVCIDGDHEPGKPLEDAMHARAHLHPDGVIILHDFMGQPVQEAALWLMDHGFQCRIYDTPHMLACTWRGEFSPPDHVPDQAIDWAEIRQRCAPFPFERTV